MGISFVFLAALCVAFANLCLRKSIDVGGSSKGYLAVQLSLAFLVNILLNPVRTGYTTWSNEVLILGIFSGIALALLMLLIGKALENGPPGLTIAALNCSTVMPAIVMALVFGSLYGHGYAWWNALGSALVVVGLVWAGSTGEPSSKKALWIILASGAFLMHVLFLVILQWHALMKTDLAGSGLLPFQLEESFDQWFMPITFFVAAAIHSYLFWSQERRSPNPGEMRFGILGGISNGASAFCLMAATEFAQPWENTMLFPLYSVLTIALCNGWSSSLYKEEVNWKATSVCLAGIVIGTVNWGSIF